MSGVRRSVLGAPVCGHLVVGVGVELVLFFRGSWVLVGGLFVFFLRFLFWAYESGWMVVLVGGSSVGGGLNIGEDNACGNMKRVSLERRS